MSRQPARLWRVFPWDRHAEEGERFSPTWIPPSQGQGRFDLAGSPGGVIYLAESPEHAVAEMIQHFRGQRLDSEDLRIAGHTLALVGVEVPAHIAGRVADLCDPGVLMQLGLRPDQTASGDRRTTQRIASTIHAAGHAGLRWWSSLLGDWHTVVLFRDRVNVPLEYDVPAPLALEDPPMQQAMQMLGLSSRRRHSADRS